MNDDTARAAGSGAGREHNEQAIRAAIRWMVMLRSGDATARDRERFEAWRNADPSHTKAAEAPILI